MSHQSPIVRFGRGLAVMILLLSGPISGYALVRIFLVARASAGWPTVPGQLTRAEVDATAAGRYRAGVSYTYNLNGAQYIGNRIRASDGEFGFREGAEQQIQGLEPGQSVEVHYDPADPSRSVLRAGAGFQEYVLLMVPPTLFSLGVFLMMHMRQRRDVT
jgi:hypothetical protein